MLNLDQYINNSIKIKIFGEEYDILEPTMEMVMSIDNIEEDITAENTNQKSVEILEVLISHNKQDRKFTKDELCKLPAEAIIGTIAEISAMRYQADADPNLKSQSQKGK